MKTIPSHDPRLLFSDSQHRALLEARFEISDNYVGGLVGLPIRTRIKMPPIQTVASGVPQRDGATAKKKNATWGDGSKWTRNKLLTWLGYDAIIEAEMPSCTITVGSIGIFVSDSNCGESFVGTFSFFTRTKWCIIFNMTNMIHIEENAWKVDNRGACILRILGWFWS